MKKLDLISLFLLCIVFSCSSHGTFVEIQAENCLEKPSILAKQLSPSPCGESVGVVEIQATSTSRLMYGIHDNQRTVFQTTNLFQNLRAGNYTFVVKNEKGCTSSTQINVESEVSYQSSIKPIIEKYCAISGCHVGTNHADFRVLANVQASAERIKTRTMSGTMPLMGTLSPAQILLIKCWVEDGTKNN